MFAERYLQVSGTWALVLVRVKDVECIGSDIRAVCLDFGVDGIGL